MILVVGATGKTGNLLVCRLIKENLPTRVLVRKPSQLKEFNDKGVECVMGDLEDHQSLDKALSGVRSLYVATPSSQKQKSLEINLLHAAKRVGVSHFIKLSVINASQHSTVNELKDHYMIEEEIKHSNIPFTFIRPNYFMQNTFRYASSLKTGTITGIFGNSLISMVDVRDIVNVAYNVIIDPKHYGQTYEVTGNISITFNDVAEVLSQQFSRKIEYKEITVDEVQKDMLNWGFTKAKTFELVKLYEKFRKGHASKVSESVKVITGNEPCNYSQFVRDYQNMFQIK